MLIPEWIKKIYNPKIKGKNRIPIYSPVFGNNEKKYLVKCIETGWISSKGNYVALFEKNFANYCNSKYAVSCSSGTAALHLSLLASGINRNHEVILPAFTMISTALAVSYTGAKPVFVDCDIETGNIKVKDIKGKITEKTKAIIPVHIYGVPADIDKITEIAKDHSICVIEDAAEAIGSEYNNKKIGNLSSFSIFSLYVNKIVTTGQGGIITTSSKKYYDELKRLNNYYFSPYRHFWHEKIGYNYKMSNLQAAVGCAQMENIDIVLKNKKRIADIYRTQLISLDKYIGPLIIPQNIKSNYWHIAYRVKKEKYDVMKLRTFLGKNGIETRSFFIPLHLQPPYFIKKYQNQFPNSEILAKTGLLLPSSPSLNEKDVKRICRLIKLYFKN